MLYDKERFILLFLLILSTFFLLSIFTTSYSVGPNYHNVSIDTQVNITNAPPTIISIRIDEDNGSISTITLNAGSTEFVYCNATIRDYNGHSDVNYVNATFWDNSTATQEDILNNNSVYRNNTCTNVGDDGQYLSYWQCGFYVSYYANNGSQWACNISAEDNSSFNTNNYNITSVDSLYALNITTNSIDYGQVPVEGISENQSAVVVNFGNKPINVSVWGYGAVPGDNLAFNCSLNANISIENERFSTNISHIFSEKNNLSGSPQNVDFTIPKQTAPASLQQNTTYWQVYIPATGNPAGLCTGTIVFEAGSP